MKLKSCLLIIALAIPLAAQEPPAAEGGGGGDLDAAYAKLKDAEEKKDVDGIRKAAIETSTAARKAEAGADKSAAAHAKEVDDYAESVVGTAAVQATEPGKIISLTEVLVDRWPKGKYLPSVSGKYLRALSSTGKAEKAGSEAEKIATGQPNDYEALYYAAEYNREKNRTDKAIAEATRIIAVFGKPKPEGMPDGAWNEAKASYTARANWVLGMSYAAQSKWPQADKSLRAALPGIENDPGLLGMAYYSLGQSNYQFGKLTLNKAQMRQGMDFFQKSAGIKGPVQAQAAQNVTIIKKELGIP